MNKETRFLFLYEAAERLGISRELARYWLETGLLAGEKIGEHWRVDESSVDRLRAKLGEWQAGYESGELINRSQASEIIGRSGMAIDRAVQRGDLELVGRWKNCPLYRKVDVERYKERQPKRRGPMKKPDKLALPLCKRCEIVIKPGQDYCPDCERERAGVGYRWYVEGVGLEVRGARLCLP